ncbi:MAG TPA: hypothetical protein VGU23_04310 [Acidobacteriaceae bacterium]|nr:hypothetical protein [Acidobacteriaceae bacterium]
MPTTHALPEQEAPSTLNLASVLLLGLSLVWCIYWFIHAWHYWEDDAYIHLEFARSVAAGRGFAFNGQVVAGDTAPLWVLLLAGTHIFVQDWMIGGKLLTVAGAVFGFAGMYAFARRLVRPLSSAAKIFPAAMVLLLAVNPYTCYWLFSGMEPIAAAGLACFAVLAATRGRPAPSSFLTACLMAGLAPLLRPEMIFLTGLLALALFAQARRLRTSSAISRVAACIGGLILIAAPLVLWSIYSLHAFGHVVPNTNAAKRALPGDSVAVRLLSIYGVGFPVILCGVLAGVALLLLRFSSVLQSFQDAISSHWRPQRESGSGRPALPLEGWIFILWAAIATVFYMVDHTYVQTRYILVTAPGLTVVVVYLFLRLSRRTARTLGLAAYVAAVAVSLAVTRPFIANKAFDCNAVEDLAMYLRTGIPADAPVATYSIGELAFLSRHPIIDTGGIIRPDAIPYGMKSSDALVQWARSAGAQYYIDSASPMPGATAVYTADLPYIGWSFHPSLYETFEPVSLWKLPATGQGTPTSGP